MCDTKMHEELGGIEEFEGVERVHFMGIGGGGMSALALLLAEKGFKVDGCDLARSDYTAKLEEAGIVCSLGHSPSHIEVFAPQLVIYSNAVSREHEELAAARAEGIRTMGRGLALSRFFNASRGIGVAGSHGKTTTSSMIGLILEGAGNDPTLAVGAEVCDIGTNARTGKSDLFVAEIDESDGSFEFFEPAVTVVTNVGWDHVNYFHTRNDVISAFIRFAKGRKPRTPLIICAEDSGSQAVIEALRNDPDVMTCGWGKSWNWGAFDVKRREGGGTVFSVAHNEKFLGNIELGVPGDHNIMNALLACAAVSSLGISLDEVSKALGGFRGAKRRLEKIGEKKNKDGSIDVIDDYGHHPTEIAASLAAMRDIYPDRRLVVVFQPHRYTRTRAFYRQMASALMVGDLVFLLPIYAAGEPSDDITSADISDIMNLDGREAVLCDDQEDALAKLESALRPGDVLMTLGAGNVTELGEAYLRR
ncbi:MAG: UDP-N-acetylmuramate--L-alanine ligase [Syntrophorhabdaceae bacterium]|nr:UDP-N-acetylmuramate--L-alanine ligase [Syntrophorhabdaceae bacterium]